MASSRQRSSGTAKGNPALLPCSHQRATASAVSAGSSRRTLSDKSWAYPFPARDGDRLSAASINNRRARLKPQGNLALITRQSSVCFLSACHENSVRSFSSIGFAAGPFAALELITGRTPTTASPRNTKRMSTPKRKKQGAPKSSDGTAERREVPQDREWLLVIAKVVDHSGKVCACSGLPTKTRPIQPIIVVARCQTSVSERTTTATATTSRNRQTKCSCCQLCVLGFQKHCSSHSVCQRFASPGQRPLRLVRPRTRMCLALETARC